MKTIIAICMLSLACAAQGQSVNAVATVAKELLHIAEQNPTEKEMSDSINRVLDGAFAAYLSGSVSASSGMKERISVLLQENDTDLYADTQEARRMEQRRMNCLLSLALLSDDESRDAWMERVADSKGNDKELSGAYVGVMFVQLLFLPEGNNEKRQGKLREIERFLRDNREFIPDRQAEKCREIIRIAGDYNKKDSTMIQPYEGIEKYDFERTAGGTKGVRFLQGQTLIEIGAMGTIGVCKEYAPASDFYTTYKIFYPNGILKEKGCYFFRSIKFGLWKHYDDNGDLTETVNEDSKFGNIKPQDIISLLEKEGWFDRKTGANKLLAAPKYISDNDSVCTATDSPHFRIDGYFTYEINRWLDVSFNSSNGYPQWFISINPTAINGWIRTTYTIDGNTGEFEKKVEPVKPPIE